MSAAVDLAVVATVLAGAALVVLRRVLRRRALAACTASPGCGRCGAGSGAPRFVPLGRAAARR